MAYFKKKAPTKTSPHSDHSVDFHIKLCLADRSMTSGEIEKCIKYQNANLSYFDHKGLDIRLKKLRLKGEIGKSFSRGNQHPLYYLTEKGFDLNLEGQAFRQSASAHLLHQPPAHSTDGVEVKHIRNLVYKIGFYHLYVVLRGWQKTGFGVDERSYQKRDFWYTNSLPMLGVSSRIEEIICEFEESDESRSIDGKKLVSRLESFLSVLERYFPEDFESCRMVEDGLSKKVRKILKDEEQSAKLSDYVKRLERKRPKKSKPKPNECPRCGYDGSDNARDGPNKGKRFPDGFVTKTLATGSMSYCQNCQYTEFNGRPVPE